jgi:acyl-CoA thioester hydrolase
MSNSDELDPFRTSQKARFRIATEVRYEDLDPNRHVNHARYLAYLEECRLALRRHLNTELGLPETLGWAIGALSIRYLRGLLYPARISVETQPIQVGRTSFTLGYGVFDDTGCAAVAASRSVCLDAAGKPTPLPDALGDWLRARSD